MDGEGSSELEFSNTSFDRVDSGESSGVRILLDFVTCSKLDDEVV